MAAMQFGGGNPIWAAIGCLLFGTKATPWQTA